MRLLPFSALLLLCSAGWSQQAVRNTTFESYPALLLANDKLELTVTSKGGTLANLVLSADPEHLSPLWNPIRMGRELGREPKFEGGAGHFVCVDGFGPVSPEEKNAGLIMHGEAHAQVFESESQRDGSATILTVRAKVPITEENFTRTFRLVDGENVITVDSELESLLGFDRPVNWAEHATIGSPFLESGVTVVDLSGSRSRTRPYPQVDLGPVQRRLMPGTDFTWPMAPGLDGQEIDLRQTPTTPHFLDHAATLLDPTRALEWVTALNPKKHLLLGYVFRRAEYPWLQYWGNYPPTQKMSRGMEFSSQPFDVPRREVVSAAPLFGAPMFHWLPAKSKIGTKFLLFYTSAPEGMQKIDDVRLEGGHLVIEDKKANKRVALTTAASLEP